MTRSGPAASPAAAQDDPDVVGYVHPWSVEPGESVRFYLSTSTREAVSAALVRLRHGDENPAGPGLKEELVVASVSGIRHERQQLRAGSYLRVDGFRGRSFPQQFTFFCWVWPSLLDGTRRVLMSFAAQSEERSVTLAITPTGEIELRFGPESGAGVRICSRLSMQRHLWYFVALSVDPVSGQATLFHERVAYSPLAGPSSSSVSFEPRVSAMPERGVFVLAAALEGASTQSPVAHASLNGKVAAPVLLDLALGADDLRSVARNGLSAIEGRHVVAAWNFAASGPSRVVPDGRDGQLNGVLVNRPMRCVAAHTWNRSVESPRESESHYNACWFHRDDLDDAEWRPSLEYSIPADWSSGIYALRLQTGGYTERIPFFVRRHPGQAAAPLAVLLPTLSYLAYANESLPTNSPVLPRRNPHSDPREYAYLSRNRLSSTYDFHEDGSGIAYSSSLRPILTSTRPTHRARQFDAPHQLGADLHLIDWLHEKGIAHDILTDHDLHARGAAALRPYRAVVLGTHHEYWTSPMVDGLEEYKAQGGRVISLSGNTCYWVTALDEEMTTIEVRRSAGVRIWESAPGDRYLSFTHERGGLWRDRGCSPHAIFGVGMTAHGMDRGAAYRRTPASYDEQFAFIFEGVDGDVIGDHPALVLGHGAAGYEIDRADIGLGTPDHAVVLATASDFSDNYQSAVEERPLITKAYSGGTSDPKVRADVVFFHCPNGGAVFSVGSITWCSVLSFNAYQNTISRITENIVRAFTSPNPLPGSEGCR